MGSFMTCDGSRLDIGCVRRADIHASEEVRHA